MGLLLAIAGAAALAIWPRQGIPPTRTDGPPLPATSPRPAAPSAEAEGHPVFEHPAPSGMISPPAEVRPHTAPRASPTVSAKGPVSRSRLAPRTAQPQPKAPPPSPPSRPSGAQGPQTGRAEEPTGGGPADRPAAAAAAPPGAHVSVTDQPSEASAPAASAASPVPAAPESSPILKSPIPLEQPSLHPVLRATITSGPAGSSALEEAAVRGRVKIRLLVRSDGGVATVEVIVSSGDAALDEAARHGPLKWRFAPATRDGVPIDAYLLIWITFSG